MTEPRKARLERSTRETKVSVELDVDGTGKFDVDCDIQFLKHMTETFARYAQFDLVLKAGGDNDHHVIEDTAIAMGEAVKKASVTLPWRGPHPASCPWTTPSSWSLWTWSTAPMRT